MTPEQIDRVFGHGRLKMATGEHVEVYREAMGPGERRRYTKRFLDLGDADFRQWTEREWRILARLIGHGVRCVPDVVHFDGGAHGGMRVVQTYDAGVTVDQWATLLPVRRDGVLQRHVFEDCAHWWALAHHCLAALDEVHALHLVHLDIKADNICIPYAPVEFDPESPHDRIHAVFGRIALIDFAFSVVSHERLASALPIGWQKDYDYQSPRLLSALDAGRGGELTPTQELDWRCDLYSLAAMLRRYLPDDRWARGEGTAAGWTPARYADARNLIYRLRECHDHDGAPVRPHAELMALTGQHANDPELAASLERGWLLAHDAQGLAPSALITPVTRVAGATSTRAPAEVAFFIATTAPTTIVPAVMRRPRTRIETAAMTDASAAASAEALARKRAFRRRATSGALFATAAVAAVALSMPSPVRVPMSGIADAVHGAVAKAKSQLTAWRQRPAAEAPEAPGAASADVASAAPTAAPSLTATAPAGPASGSATANASPSAPTSASAPSSPSAPASPTVAASPIVAASPSAAPSGVTPAEAPATTLAAGLPPAAAGSATDARTATATPVSEPATSAAAATTPAPVTAAREPAVAPVPSAAGIPSSAAAPTRVEAGRAVSATTSRQTSKQAAQSRRAQPGNNVARSNAPTPRTQVAGATGSPRAGTAGSAPASVRSSPPGTSVSSHDVAATGRAAGPTVPAQAPVQIAAVPMPVAPTTAPAPEAAATVHAVPGAPAQVASTHSPTVNAAAASQPPANAVPAVPASVGPAIVAQSNPAPASAAPSTGPARAATTAPGSAPSSNAAGARSSTGSSNARTPAPRREPWQDGLHQVLQALGVIGLARAPVEERSVPVRPAPEAAPPPSRPPTAPAAAPVERRAPEPARTTPIAPEPKIAGTPVETPRGPTTAVEPARTASISIEPARTASIASEPARSMSIGVEPPRNVASAAETVGGRAAADAGRDAASMIEPPRHEPPEPPRSGYALRGNGYDEPGLARRAVTEALPRSAAQAFADATPALSLAAIAEHPSQSSAVREAALAPWRSERQFIAVASDSSRARQLHDESRHALAYGRNGEALDAAWRAFAADPRSPDIAGFLAYLNLRASPAQPEIARQLALHALAMSGSRRTVRIDQWNTLAIASALTGREGDATRAMLVGLALAPDADHACRAAVSAYMTYGGPLHGPVQALLRRTHAQGRDTNAPACAWPSYRVAQSSP